MTTEQLKTLFDEFVSELEKTNTSSVDITLTKQIVSALVNLPNKSKQLTESELVAHPFMIFCVTLCFSINFVVGKVKTLNTIS